MIRNRQLVEESDKVNRYIEAHTLRAGVESKEEVLSLFENMHQLFPGWVIATCPVMHPAIQYVTRNCTHVFGWEQDSFSSNARLEKYFRYVHEADQEDLYHCLRVMHEQMTNISPEEHCDYRHVFHYRFRKPDGQIIYLHDEKATLCLKNAGNLYYSLFRDITPEKIFGGVKIEQFGQPPFLTKLREFKPSAERNPLSRRENELVALLRQGLTTKEIAWRLNISHNTVRNIKSRLFEKFNVNNNIELLNLAG